MKKIDIVPIGTVDRSILSMMIPVLVNRLPRDFTLSTQQIEQPYHAYNNSRNQYNAELILGNLSPNTLAERTLYIVDIDLYVPERTFIFGEASSEDRMGIVSLARLYNLDLDLTMSRIIKESLHELGHTYGQEHCPDYRCVMHFCPDLIAVDNKSSHYCPYHDSRILNVLSSQ